MLTERLYLVNEAAAELRLSPWTIWDLMKRGELVRTKVAGRTFLRESELQKLIVDRVNSQKPGQRKRVRAIGTTQGTARPLRSQK